MNEIEFYYFIAFYTNGNIRCFNTKKIPSPSNRNGPDGKLIEVIRFSKIFKKESFVNMNNGVLETAGEMEISEFNLISEFNPRKVSITLDQHSKLIEHFTYHAPTEGQKPCYEAINKAAFILAQAILFNAPAGPDQTLAIRKVIEAKMTANSAIAIRPDLY